VRLVAGDEAGSRMTLQAAIQRFFAVAILAATWDSRSTATVPCACWRRKFRCRIGQRRVDRKMAACIDPGTIDTRRRARPRAGNCPVSATREDAIGILKLGDLARAGCGSA
jgi:hypothetical protein